MSYTEGEGNKEKQKNIFNISVILHFGIALLLGIVLLGAGYFFFNGILNIPAERMYAAHMIYSFMIVSTMFTVMTVPYDAVLNAHENMLYYAIVGIVESVLKLAVAFVVVYTVADKLIVYGALMAGISLAVMIIMRVYCHRKYEECVFKPRRYYDKALMKEMTGFAGWNFLNSFSSIITNYGQNIVLNIFFGTIVNAAQGIANQLCAQLSVFANTMLKALNPIITKKEGGKDRDSMLKISMMGSKIAFFLLMFLFIPVFIEMPFIFNVWLKDVPYYTIIFCRLLIIRFLIEQLFITLNSAIDAVGNIRNFRICQSIQTLSILPIAYILFSLQYPPYLLHIIFILFACISIAITLYFTHKICNLSIRLYFTQIILRCVISFAVIMLIAFIPTLLMNVSKTRFLVVTILCVVLYIVIIWFYGLSKEEHIIIGQLKEFIKIKINNVRK
jgi:O-antigen/teichoic acid export membrane protein